jgi:GT2 family glycosyltransferase
VPASSRFNHLLKSAGRCRSHRGMTLGDPCVSLVVPLSCGPDQALRCLEGIAAQGSEPSFEVIVIDDATVGLAPLLTQLDGDVEVLHSERRLGLAGSIRLALSHARGATTLILRDGAVPSPGWLAGLASALDDPAVGIAFSLNDGDPATPALAAWSAAVRTQQLRAVELPPVADDLVLGTLALAIAADGRHAQVVTASSVAGPGRAGAGSLEPGHSPELTIVIPTLDATSERVRRCLSAIAAVTDVAHEVVIVDNGSPPQGFSAPVNAGMRAARAPYIVVMNDDVEPEPGWWPPLRDAIDAGAVVAFPLTVDGAMRTDFAAWCFAIGRQGVDDFAHEPDEFFDPSLVIWFQDTDLLTRLRRAGRPPLLIRESRIRHGLSQTLGSPDPRLRAWVRNQVEVDKRRFEAKHPEARLQAQTL